MSRTYATDDSRGIPASRPIELSRHAGALARLLPLAETLAALERDHSSNGLLYWRHLECADASREGAFLAGGFWVAQYWVLKGDLDRARAILEAGLAYANDVGLFAEEAEPRGKSGGAMLGNIPQSFVHAAFIGAVIDLKQALACSPSSETAKRKD